MRQVKFYPDEEIEERIRNIEREESRVRILLEQDDKCRNSDPHLQKRIYISLLKKHFSPEEKLTISRFFDLIENKKLPSTESIRRARQKIQNTDGMFLPTDPSVIEERGISREARIIWGARAKEMGYDPEEILKWIDVK